MPTTDSRLLAEQLLTKLAGEEDLLRQARECVMGLHASLRKGDVAAVQTALPRHEALAARLGSAAARRQTAAAALAEALGLPATASLQQIAPPPRTRSARSCSTSAPHSPPSPLRWTSSAGRTQI